MAFSRFSPIGFLLSSVQAEREGVSDPQARTRLALLGGLLGGSPVMSLTLTTVLARNEREDSEATTSTIPRLVRVPGFKGKSPEEAERNLSALGLKASRQNVFNKKVQQGLISEQNPDEGALVPEGAVVRLYVSQGPRGYDSHEEQDTVQAAADDAPTAGVAETAEGESEKATRRGRSGNARRQQPATQT